MDKIAIYYNGMKHILTHPQKVENKKYYLILNHLKSLNGIRLLWSVEGYPIIQVLNQLTYNKIMEVTKRYTAYTY